MDESRKNDSTQPLLVEPTQRSTNDVQQELSQNPHSLEVHTNFRKHSESYLDEMLEDMENASVEHCYQKNQKLSKSRGINLSRIELNEATRPKSIALGELRREYSTPVASSPVSYTIRNDSLHVNDMSRMRHSDSFHKSSEDNVVDIRIYVSNGQAVQFAVEDGTNACAEDLLFLMAEHKEIDEDVANATLALWLISPLFEIQLKPHHIAFEVHNKWPLFLRRFTNSTEEEIVFDEPLLVIRRNVRLSIAEERMYQDTYNNLVEILYYDAKDEFMTGRYIIDIQTCVKVSALQLLIEDGPLQSGENAFDNVHDNLPRIVPACLLNRVKSFHLFGLIECKSGLEKQIIKEYKKVSKQYNQSCTERQKAYLDVLREIPSYGATFFNAQTDKEGGSLFEKSKRLIGGQQQLDLLVGVNCEYLTIADKQKNEILLTRRISDCSWFRSQETKDEEDEMPSFFIHFPDDEALIQLGSDNSSPTDQVSQSNQNGQQSPVLVSRLLHIFSQQASLIENLMNQFYEQSASALGSTEELGSLSAGHTPQSEINSPLSCSLGTSNKSTTSKSSKSIRSDVPSPPSSIQYPSKLSKLCTAKLDENGKCIEARGTLRRILLECN